MQHDLNNFIDFSIFSAGLSALPSRKQLLVNTINQYSYCIAQEDDAFKKSLQDSDVLLPDGIGVVAAVRLLTGQIIKKVAGADIHQYMLEKLNKTGGKCFYLGATNATLKLIKDKMSLEYPNVSVGTYSPPFKNEFDADDNKQMIDAVNAFQPDVLFVGMTAPKQEKWVNKHKSKINTQVICTIGAVFDFYAGTIERPSSAWRDLGLEWFVRLVKEPVRMSRRYLYFGPVFVFSVLKEKAKMVLFHKSHDGAFTV